MALFGFNKQKVLANAEKYVQQGKLQNAISEYEKILKNDPKDLTVTNTVGDLYSRLGESDKATDCFKTVGDAYASQGFTVKAIAMYKKISKLKPSLESLLKLAELYTQQGLFNDARSQYLQVADEFLKAGELENAVRIFQKILEMDPENSAMRVRLAEVYVRLGKKTDAWQIFTQAAESMRSKGSLQAAEEVLQRMLTLDPGNTYALLMQGKNLVESGDAAGAVATLQKIGDIDSNPDALRDLLKAYLQTGQLSEAGAIAGKLLTVHNDLTAISTFADALMQAGQFENALQLYDQHAERLLAQNSDKVLEHLHSIIGHVRENPDSLQKLLDLFHKAGETTHVGEVLELLAHASVQSGDLGRARDMYQKLAQIEPQNPLHMQNYQQVVSQLSGTSGVKLITPEEAVVLIDDLEATAPAVHQHYSDEVALSVRSALTDAELFISYNMPAKALGPLVGALPMAPTDLRLNQRLAALHTRAGRFAEAAVCCRTLQTVYSEAGYPDEATRYGELAERYEERSSLPAPPRSHEDEEPIFLDAPAPSEHRAKDTVPEFAIGEQTVEAVEVPEEEPAEPEAAPADEHSPWPVAAAAAEMAVEPETPAAPVEEMTVSGEAEGSGEIDLSSEWDDTITVEGEAPAEVEAAEVAEEPAAAPVVAAAPVPAARHSISAEKIAETVEEIRFYVGHGMPEQAMATLARLQTLAPGNPTVQAVRTEVEAALEAAAQEQSQEAAAEAPAGEEEVIFEELTAEDIPSNDTVEVSVDEAPAEAEEPAEVAVEPVHVEAAHAEPFHVEPVELEPAHAAVAHVEPVQVEPVHVERVHMEAAPVAPIHHEEPAVVKASAAPEPEPEPEPVPPPKPPARTGVLKKFVSALESSFLPKSAKTAPPAPPVVKETKPSAPAAKEAKPAPAQAGPPVAAPVPAPKPAPAPAMKVAKPAPAPPPKEVKPVVAPAPETAKPVVAPAAAAAKPAAAHAEPQVAAATGPASSVLGEFVADIEASLGDDFLSAAPVIEAPAAAPAPPQAPVPAPAQKAQAPVAAPAPPVVAQKTEQPLAAGAAASASSVSRVPPAAQQAAPAWARPAVEVPKPQPPATPISQPPAPAAAKASPFTEEAGVDLAEMFGELKQDLESGVSAADEDPETHYNLGIAFREMGLLDEAIGELQKACQAFDRGRPFPQIMQTYTWLAQCFLEKGIPEAAVRWYDKALNVTGIDGETRVALNYELASAYESAGDKPTALKHFMEVYGNNIDYRDVAERIRALKS